MAKKTVFLLAFFCIAAAPRLIGIQYGFPFLYHPDEEIFIGHAIRMGGGDLNPHWYNYPHFYMYLLLGADAVYFLLMKVAGIFPDLAAFRLDYILSPWKFYFIGRLISSVMGIAGVACVYWGAKELAGRWAGIASGLVLAVFSPHVFLSKTAVADAPMTFFVCLSTALLCGFFSRKKWPWFYGAVAAAALGVATKYNAGFLILALVPALVFTPGAGGPVVRAKAAAVSVALGLLFLFFGSPYLFLDFKSFRAGLSEEYSYVEEGWLGFEGVDNGWIYHLATLWRYFGPALFLFLVGGMAWMTLARRNWPSVALAANVAIAFLYLGTRKILSPHYLFPILPPLCVIGGLTFEAARTRLNARRENPERTSQAAAVALLAVLFVPSWGRSMWDSFVLRRLDTRTQTYDWAMKNIPAGSSIALEAWGPQFGIDREEIERKYQEALKSDSGKADFYRLRLEKGVFSPFKLYGLNVSESNSFMEKVKDPARYDFQALVKMGIDYTVVNESMSSRYRKFPDLYPAQNAFYAELEAKAERIAGFSASAQHSGPGTVVYKMPSEP